MGLNNLFKKWKKFTLNERNYTPEELAADELWNDLDQQEIDGFFWNAAGDATLDAFTDIIYYLARDAGRNLANEEEWRDFRDEVMVDYRDISDAYDKMAPEVDPPSSIETDPGTPGAAERQSEKKEKELKDKAQELIIQAIDDIKKEFRDVNVDEILQLFNDEIESYEFTDEE